MSKYHTENPTSATQPADTPMSQALGDRIKVTLLALDEMTNTAIRDEAISKIMTSPDQNVQQLIPKVTLQFVKSVPETRRGEIIRRLYNDMPNKLTTMKQMLTQAPVTERPSILAATINALRLEVPTTPATAAGTAPAKDSTSGSKTAPDTTGSASGSKTAPAATGTASGSTTTPAGTATAASSGATTGPDPLMPKLELIALLQDELQTPSVGPQALKQVVDAVEPAKKAPVLFAIWDAIP